MMDNKIGVINEIGDMGLGFDELSDKDQKVYNEEFKPAQSDKKSVSGHQPQKSTTKN